MNYSAQRRQALVNSFKGDGVDAFLVTAPVNVTYLTGFAGDSTYYVATAKTGLLVSDDRFAAQIAEECKGIDAHIRPHDKTTLQAAVEVLTKAGAKAVGVEANRLTVDELRQLQELGPKLTFVPVANRVEDMRVVKDPSEVEAIRAAVRVAERAFRMFAVMARETDTEKMMVDALEGYIRQAGAKSSSFPPIVAVGDRGSLPHAPPTDRPLGDGSKLLVDWGADLGYKSDMTRVVRSPFTAAPTRRNKYERVGFDLDDVYAAVVAAQDAALATIRAGAKARDVDAAARTSLAKVKMNDVKLGDHFTHGLGHGIGLEVHEAPRVRANSDDVLQAGMVITVEPGVYIPEWGGVRVEDMVLVTKDGYSLLTSTPRDPNLIK